MKNNIIGLIFLVLILNSSCDKAIYPPPNPMNPTIFPTFTVAFFQIGEASPVVFKNNRLADSYDFDLDNEDLQIRFVRDSNLESEQGKLSLEIAFRNENNELKTNKLKLKLIQLKKSEESNSQGVFNNNLTDKIEASDEIVDSNYFSIELDDFKFKLKLEGFTKGTPSEDFILHALKGRRFIWFN